MDTREIKNIKIVGADIQRVMVHNEVWWGGVLKPDYEFYDSEIGKNSNWSKDKSGYWYLSKFKGQHVVFVRHNELQRKNALCRTVANLYIKMPISDDYNGYTFYEYSTETYLILTSELWLFPAYEDNTYKTYVFKCTNKYSEQFHEQLEDFANSL